MKSNAINQTLTVVVPVYNEAKNIAFFIKRLRETLATGEIPFEIICVDDNSIDGSTKILQKLAKERKIKVVTKNGKKGKAFSLKQGFDLAKGSIITMIDADMQYPPEEIPAMIAKLQEADIVVAHRKQYGGSPVRRVLSRGFRSFFGKTIFGLDHDIQSGLKVFKKEVWDLVVFTPRSPWTLDLEFLHRAREVGFIITNHEIDFVARTNGTSKVDHIKTSFELGMNAINVRMREFEPLAIKPTDNKTMVGAGIGYKRNRYITHTTLSHHKSAIKTFSNRQTIALLSLLLIILAGLLINPLFTAQLAIAILSSIYFLDVLFNFYIVVKSVNNPYEITLADKEINQLLDTLLPTYTILCPLYKEVHVLPQFLEGIDKLEWPKEKLDVLLLLEEDDKESIETTSRMKLPSYVRVVVVPHSIPKTKPKACNYGLNFAKGEYLVIYDAEDIPDPLQLKKAYAVFQKVDRDVVCLQAKLNYYNPHQNLLTRFFTAEYSLWFDLTLPGLQSLNTSIPLGGTSNHFRVDDLLRLKGWDPFNVAEDADLGVRLFREGYKTAIIDSVTLEEASSSVKNWIRQRSRWIKGYMQTYLLHIRFLPSFTREKGIHAFIFQLIIGGKIAFILINPFLWVATIAYFALYAYVGPTIEALYPSYVFYMAAFSLIFGNFLFMYYYMIGCAKKEQWSLMKFVLLIPLYWLLISAAATVSLYQLLFKPHYWEKTLHGMHLNKKVEENIEKTILQNEEQQIGFRLSRLFKEKLKSFKEKKTLYLGGIMLISLTMVSNILNFVFNIYLGRTLSLETFGELSLFTSLLYLISIPLGSFSAAISHNVAYIYGKQSKEHAQGYLRYIFGKSIRFGVLLTFLWLVCTPFLVKFFHTSSFTPILLFAPLLLVSVAGSNFSGFMAGTLGFGKKGLVLSSESVVRLIVAFILVALGFSNIIVAAIVVSISASVLLGWLLVRSKNYKDLQPADKKFNKMFFFISALNGISLIAFLTLDVILVKHFLTPRDAGEYGLLSLVGKMTYFMGSLFGPFMVPLVSHNEGANKDSKNTFLLLFLFTAAFSFISFVGLGALGGFTVPLIFGVKTMPIVPLLIPYVLAMALFTISQPIVSYFQAKENYSFTVVGFFVSILQITLISLFHQDLKQIVLIMLFISIINLLCMLLLFLIRKNIPIIYANLKDFLELFSKKKNGIKPSTSNTKKILIFNWRDKKHKWAGGAELYIHELSKRWVKEGHEVTIFSGNDTNSPRNETVEGIKIKRRGGFYFVYIWAFLYYMLKYRGKYNIIIDCENGIPFFTPLYTKEKTFLLIHHVHQEVFRKSLKPPFSLLASFLELKLMPFVYRNTEVITVSPSTKREILKHNLTKKEPIVIYNGVDLSLFKPGKKSKNPSVLYLGRLQYYKSLDVLIKAATRIIEEIPSTQFIIAGEGGEKKRLQKLTQELGLEENITFLGKVSDEEKIKLFQEAWVFVNPSFMEGWGITTIEANACGTPVVASNVPGLQDSIKDQQTGFLVEYGNSGEFAKKIIEVIKNKELREKVIVNAIEWAKKYDWDISAVQSLKIIAQNEEANEVRSVELAKVQIKI